jgi:hypothetical protein
LFLVLLFALVSPMRLRFLSFVVLTALVSPLDARAAQEACASGEITVSGRMGGVVVPRDASGVYGPAPFALVNPSCGSTRIVVMRVADQPFCGFGREVLVTGQYYRAGTPQAGYAAAQTDPNLPPVPLPVLAGARLTCPGPPPLQPFQEAYQAQKLRNWDRVIQITTDAIAAGNVSNELVVYQLRANAYVRKYRYDEALSDANHVVGFQPPDRIRWPQALNVRGVVHAAAGRYDNAIADHTAAIDQLSAVGGRSVTSCFYYDRAMAHARNGDPQRAAEDIAAGLTILGETLIATAGGAQAKGQYCLGVAKLKLGDQSGHADIETATALNPSIIPDMQRLHGVAGF